MTPSEMAARIRDFECAINTTAYDSDEAIEIQDRRDRFLGEHALEIASMLEAFSGRTVSCICEKKTIDTLIELRKRLAFVETSERVIRDRAYNEGLEAAAKVSENTPTDRGILLPLPIRIAERIRSMRRDVGE